VTSQTPYRMSLVTAIVLSENGRISKRVVGLNSPQPEARKTVTNTAAAWLLAIRLPVIDVILSYSLTGSYLNFCPPTAASYIRPALVMVMTATPLL